MTDAPEDWTLCVDFGTAFSKAAAAPRDAWSHFEPSGVRPLLLGAHEEGGNPFLLASAVFVDEDRILFGNAAVERASSFPTGRRQALRSFKTLLSVSDLERVLNTAAPATIDPHRMFPMRDLIVMYLAYLTASIDRAIGADPILSEVEVFERRYAAPAWRGGDSAGMHDVIVRLFAEAEALCGALGDQLRSDRGVAVSAAPGALAAARSRPQFRDMGLVFEATAAAAYTSIGLEESASHLIVLDVGAGTTDIAALARRGRHIEELPEARVTLKQAGDRLDKIIANLAIESCRWARSEAHQTALWASLMHNMRDIKESIFLDGHAMLRFEGRTLTVPLRDLERNAEFRQFVDAVSEAYEQSLGVIRDAARAANRREIQTVAVGGGAAAPFVQELIRRKPPRAGKINFIARPATPEWAHAREFRGNLAPVFPQLAIAIGGALAPDTMLAAVGAFSRVAGGQTGSRAARD